MEGRETVQKYLECQNFFINVFQVPEYEFVLEKVEVENLRGSHDYKDLIISKFISRAERIRVLGTADDGYSEAEFKDEMYKACVAVNPYLELEKVILRPILM